MAIDYRFLFLEKLHGENQTIDLRSFFMPMVKREEITRQQVSRLLYSLKEDDFIWHDDISSLSRRMAGEYADHLPINVRITYKGVDEYLRLRKQYGVDKEPVTIHIGGDVHGSVVGSQSSFVATHLPAETPKAKTINSRIKKAAQSIGKFILENILKIIVGIVTAYLVIKLGFKK